MIGLIQRTGRRIIRLSGVMMMLAAGSGAVVAVSAGTAEATTCGTAIAAGNTCTLTGTLTITAGTLTLTSPSSLTWADTLNGLNQTVYDTTAGDESYLVNDATGSGAGWNVTVSATQFTTGSHTLNNSGTLSTNGSLTSATANTAPTTACFTGSTCTLPSNSTSYPVPITTGAAAVKIYDDATSAGLGDITIGNVGWWLAIPANTLAGVYTSTFTYEINSGP